MKRNKIILIGFLIFNSVHYPQTLTQAQEVSVNEIISGDIPADDKVQKLKEVLVQMTNDLDNRKQKIIDIAIERDQLLDKTSGLEKEKKALEDEIFRLMAGDFGAGSKKEINKKINEAKNPLERKLADTAKSIVELNKQITAKDTMISQFKKEKEDCLSQVKLIENELSGYKKNNQELIKNLSDVKTSLNAKFAEEKNELDARIAEFDQKIKDRQVTLNQKENELRELVSQKDQLQKELNNQQSSAVKAIDQSVELKAQLAQVKNDTQRLIDEVKQPLQSKINELNDSLTKRDDQIKNKQLLIDDLSKQLNVLSVEIKDAQSAKSKSENLIVQAQEQLNRSQIMNDVKAKQSQDEVNAKLAGIQKDYVKAQTRAKENENLLKKKSELVNQLQEQLKSIAGSKSETENQISELKKSFEIKTQSYQQTLSQIQEPLNEKIKVFTDEVAKNLDIIKSRDEQINQLNSQIVQLQKQIENLILKDAQSEKLFSVSQEELKSLKNQKNALLAQTKDFTTENEKITAQLKQAIERSAVVKNDLQSEKDKIQNDMTQNIALLQSKLDDVTNSYRSSDGMLKKLVDEKSLLEEQLQTTNNSVGQLEKEIAAQNINNEAIQIKYQKDAEEIKANLATQNNALNTQIKSLEANLNLKEKLVTELSKTVEKLKNTLETEKFSRQEIEKDLAVSRNQVATLNKSVEERVAVIEGKYLQQNRILQKDIDGKYASIKQEKSEIEALGNSIKFLNDEIVKIQETNKDFANKNVELIGKLKNQGIDIESRIIESKKPLLIKVEELATAQQKYVENLKAVQTQLGETEKAKQQLRADLVTALQEKQKIDENFQRASQRTGEVQQLYNDKLQQAKASFDEKNSALNVQLAKFSLELSEKEKFADSLGAQIKQLKEDLKQASKEKESLFAKLSIVQNGSDEIIGKLKQNLAQNDDEYQNSVKKIKESEEQLSKANRDLEEISKAKVKSENELNSLKETFGALKQQFAEQLDEQKRLAKESINELSGQVQDATRLIIEKNKNIESFNVQIRNFSTQLIDKSNTIEALNQQIVRYKVEIQTLDANIPQRISDAKKNLEVKLTSLEEKFNSSVDNIRSKDSLIKELSEKIKMINDDAINLSQARNKLQESLDQQAKDFEMMRKSLPLQIEEVRKPLADKIASLQTELNLANANLELRKIRIDELVVQSNVLNQNLVNERMDKESALKNLNDSQIFLKNSQNSIPEKIMEARTPLLAQIKNLEDFKLRNEELVGKITQQMRFLEGDKKGLNDQLLQWKKKNELLEKLSNELQIKLKSVQDSIPIEIAKVKEPFSLEIRNLNDQIKSNNESIKTKEQRISQLETEFRKLQDVQKDLIQKKQNLEIEISGLTEKNGDLVESIPAKIAGERKPLEEKINALVSQLQEMKNANQLVQNNIQKLNATQKELLLQIDERKKEKDALTAQLRQAQEEIVIINQSMPAKINQERKPLEDKIAKLSVELTNASKQLNDELKNISELKLTQGRLSKQFNEMTVSKEKVLAQLQYSQKKINEMSESIPVRISQERKPLDEKIIKLSSSLEQIQKQFQNAQETMTQVGQMQNGLNKELNETRLQKVKVEEQLRTAKEQIISINEDVPNKIAQERRPLESKIVQILNEKNEISQKLKENESSIYVLNKQIQQYAQQINALTNEKVQLNEQMIVLKEKSDTLQSSFSSRIEEVRKPLIQKIEDVKNQLELNQKLIEQKEASFKDLQNKFNEQNAQLDTVINQLGASQNDVTNKAEALSQLTDTADELKLQLKTTSNDLIKTNRELENQKSYRKETEVQLEEMQLTYKKLQDSVLSQIALIREPLEKSLNEAANQNKIFVEKMEQLESSIKNSIVEKSNLMDKVVQLEYGKKLFENKVAEASSQLSEFQNLLPIKIEAGKKPLVEKIEQLNQRIVVQNGIVKENENQLASLNAEVKNLQSQLDQNKLRVEQLRQDSDKLTSDNQSLIKSLPEKIAQEKKPLEEQIAKNEQNLLQLRLSLKEATEKNSELEKTREKAENQIAVLKRNNDDVTTQWHAMAQSFERLNQSVPQKTLEVRRPLEEKISALQKQSTNLTENLKDKSSLLEILENEKIQLIRSLKDHQQTIVSINKSLSDNQNELKNTNDAIPKKINQEKEPLIQKISSLEAQLQKANEDAGKLTQQLKSLEDSKRSVAEDLKSTLDEKEKLGQKIESLNVQVTKSNETHQKEISDLNQNFEQKISSINQKLNDFSRVNGDQSGKIQELVKAKTQLEDKVKSLAQEREKLNGLLVEQKNLISQNRFSLPAQIDAAKKPLIEQLSAFQKKWELNESNLKQKVDENQKLSAEMNLFQNELNKAGADKKFLTGQIETLKDKFKQTADDLSMKVIEVQKPLQTKIEDFTNQLQLTQSLVQEKESAINVVNKRFTDLKSQLDKTQIIKKEMSEEIDSLKKQIVKISDEAAKKLAESEKVFEQKNRGLTTSLDDKSKQIVERESQIAKISSMTESLNKQLEQQMQENANLTKNIDDLTRKLKVKQADADSAIEQIKDEYEKKQLDSKNTVQQVNETLASRVLEIKNLENQRDGLNKNREDLISQVTKLEQQLSDLQNDKNKISESISEQIALERKGWEGKIAALNDVMARLQADLKVKELEVQKLNEDKNVLSKHLEDETRVRQNIEAELGKNRQAFESLKQKNSAEVASVKQSLEFQQNNLLAKLKEEQLNIDNVARKLQESLTKSSQSEDSLNKLRQQNDKLSQDLISSQLLLKDIQNDLPQRISSAEKSWQEKNIQLTNTIEDKDRALNLNAQSIKELNETIEDLHRKMEEVSSQRDDVQKNFESAQNKFKEKQLKQEQQLTDLKNSYEQKLADLSSLVVIKDKNTSEILDSLNELKKTKQTLTKQNEEILIQKTQLELSLGKSQQQWQEESRVLNQQFESEKRNLNDKLSASNAMILSKANMIQEFEKNINDFKSEKNDLLKEKAATEKDKISLLQDRDRIQIHLKENEKKVNTRIESLQKELNDQITKLQENLKSKEQLVIEQDRRIKTLVDQNVQLGSEMNQLQSSKRGLEIGLAKVTEELQVIQDSAPQILSDATKSLEDKIAALEQEIINKDSQISRVTSDHLAVNKNLSQQQESNASLNKEVVALREQIKSIQANWTNRLTQERIPFEEKVAELNKLLDTKSQLLKNVEFKLNEANSSFDQQAEEITKLQVQFQASVESSKNAQQDFSNRIAQEKKNFEEKIIQFEKEKQSVTGLISEKESHMKELSTKAQTLSQDLTRAVNENVSMGKNIQNLQSQLNEYKTIIEKLKRDKDHADIITGDQVAEIDRVSKLLQTTQMNLQNALEIQADLQANNKQLQNQIDKSNSELADLNISSDKKLVEQKNNSLKEAEAITLQISQLKDQVATKDKEILGLTQKSSGLENDIQNRTEERNSLQASLNKTKGDLKLLEDSFPEKIQTQRKNFENQNSQLLQKIQTMQQSIKERDAGEIESQKKYSNVQDQVTALNAEKKILADSYQKLQNELKSIQDGVQLKLQAERQPLLDQIAQLNLRLQSLDQAIREKETSGQAYQNEHQKLQDHLVQMSSEKEDAQARLKEIQMKLDETNRQRQELQSSLDEQKNKKMIDDPQTLAQLQEMQAQLQLKEADIQNKNKTISQMMDDQEKLKQGLKTLQIDRERMTEEISRLNSRVSDNVIMNEKLDKAKTSWEKNVQALENELTRIKGSVNNQMKDAQDPWMIKIKDFERQVALKDKMLLEKNETIEGISRDKDVIAQEYSRLQNQKADLVSEMTLLKARVQSNGTIPTEILQVKKPLEDKIFYLEQKLKEAEGKIAEKELIIRGMQENKSSLRAPVKKPTGQESWSSIKDEINKTMELIGTDK